MRLADRSFLMALFLSGDQNYGTAEREAARPEPILIVSEVLAETLGVLQKRKGVDFARLAKEWMDSKPHIQFGFTQRTHFDDASRLFLKSRERLNYVDCILGAWAMATKAPLVTFDEGLRRAVKKLAA